MAAVQQSDTQSNRPVIQKLLLLVALMFGFGYALVPLYDVFCEVTGLNGKTPGQVVASSNLVVDESRTIRVTFLASLNESMPWEFKPQQSFVEVHPGQPTTIFYTAKNIATHNITGQAVPSVAPGLAAAYFQKTECFCFTQQELKPGEEKLMPVTFIVDSALPKKMNELILSYTFFTSPDNKQAGNKKLVKQNKQLSFALTHNQDQKL